MAKIQYLLDTNIFIEASKKYYHFDICPDFWSMLIEQHEAGRVFSIEQVKKEIDVPRKKQNAVDPQNDATPEYDGLASWVKKAPKSLFESCDDLLVPKSYTEIIQSVELNSQYRPEAKHEFASVADSWLIAYAHANNMTVVTHENFSPDSKKRVLIPVVCKEFHVPVVTLFEMLLKLKIKFVRKQTVTRKKGK